MGTGYVLLTCVAVPTQKQQSNRRLETPLPLYFSCRILWNSTLAPNFPINPLFRKADMGFLVHSLECGRSTAVLLTSCYPGLVAEDWKCGSRCLNLPFLVLCNHVYFYCTACRRKNRSSYLFFKKKISCSPLCQQSKRAPYNSVFSLDARADTSYELAVPLQQLLCS